MDILDFILNLVGLSLWLNWRATGGAAVPTAPGVSLLRTLRRAETARGTRWGYLVGLGVLLLFRTAIYRQVGAAVQWTPHLHLGVVTLPFRSDSPGRILLFSLFSFGLTLGIFYLWLLVLSVVNRRLPDTDPLHLQVRLRLGWAERLPTPMRLWLPPVAAAMLWLVLSPLWARLGIMPPVKSDWQTVQQAVVMGLATFPAWKYLLIGILLLHLVNSYIYLGNSPLWLYVSATGRNLLALLRWMPLRVGRFDLAPLVAMGLVFLAAEFASKWLTEVYRRLPI